MAEDDAAIASGVAELLQRAGFVTDLASDGGHADYLVRTETYDAVVLDLGLPVHDGLSLLRGWREDGLSVPVLILTARARWPDKAAGFSAGADNYVAKPFGPMEVVVRVQALVRRSRGQSRVVLHFGEVALDTGRGEVTVAGMPVLILVAGPQAHIDAEVKIVVRRLGMTLGALGGILFVVFVVQIRWGLAPLRRMTDDLQAVRAGKRPRLDTRLSLDLAQLAGAMNEVLDHQVALIGRGRATAGNLAHALKQPLASLRMQLARHEPDLDALRQALKQIDPTIDHHLTRAAVAGQAGGHYQKVMAAGVIAPLVEGIRRMYGGQDKVIRATVPETLQVSIDPQDLQELVGNLLENAAKWAESIATLSWVAGSDGWTLTVEDDGPGLPVEARDGVLARGARLDEKRPGSGLGLAIVNDLVTLYQLSIALDDSPLGGLRVVVASKAGTP